MTIRHKRRGQEIGKSSKSVFISDSLIVKLWTRNYYLSLLLGGDQEFVQSGAHVGVSLVAGDLGHVGSQSRTFLGGRLDFLL